MCMFTLTKAREYFVFMCLCLAERPKTNLFINYLEGNKPGGCMCERSMIQVAFALTLLRVAEITYDGSMNAKTTSLQVGCFYL